MALVGNLSGSTLYSSKIGITGSVVVANQPDASFPLLPNDALFYVSGSATKKAVFDGGLTVSGSANVAGGGNLVLSNAAGLHKFAVTGSTGNTSVAGTFDVAGASTLASVSVTGASTLASVTATTVSASSDLQVGGNITIQGNISSDANENKSIFSEVTSGDNVISLGGGGQVRTGGDLTVQGNDISGSAGLNLTLGISGLVTTAGNLSVGGTTLNSPQTTFTLLSSPTGITIGGNSTSTTIGKIGGTLTTPGTLAVNGGSITSTATSAGIFTSGVATVGLGLAAHTVTIGATTGSVNVGTLNVGGDLNVAGTVTSVNTTNLEVKDSLIGLGFASGTVAQIAGDRGIIGGIGAGNNVAMFWQNAKSEFVLGRTTSTPSATSVTVASYSNMHVGDIQASIVTASLGFSGSHTTLADGSSAFVAGNNVTITSASNGAVTISAASTPSAAVYIDSTTSGAMFATGSLVLTGGEVGVDAAADKGTDIYFYVSGSLDGSSKSVFGGNVVTSGSVRADLGLSGSLTTLANGTSYLVAGTNVTIASSSNGQVTISAGGGTGADSNASYLVIATTGSLPNERSIAMGTGLLSTDNGAGGSYSIAIDDSVVATVSGTTFKGTVQPDASGFRDLGTTGANWYRVYASQFSGSLTQLTNGTSYLVAGTNVTITSGSTGQVTISATGGGGASYFDSTTSGAIFATGSLAIKGAEAGIDAAADKGADVFFYVSGSKAAGEVGVSLFGGMAVVSGALDVKSPITGSSALFRGDVMPDADMSYNMGAPTMRWANVYTGDLHLRNDRGSWTVIEEESYLSIRNNKTGKLYKFVLEAIEE